MIHAQKWAFTFRSFFLKKLKKLQVVLGCSGVDLWTMLLARKIKNNLNEIAKKVLNKCYHFISK